MNLKQKITLLVSVLTLATGVASLQPLVASAAQCGGAETSIISCGQKKINPKDKNVSAKDSGVWGLLVLALQIMTAGVGIAAVGGIVYGAILYATARDSAETTKKAIGIITNVVIGLIAYALMFIILNFLIPGGIFAKG